MVFFHVNAALSFLLLLSLLYSSRSEWFDQSLFVTLRGWYLMLNIFLSPLTSHALSGKDTPLEGKRGQTITQMTRTGLFHPVTLTEWSQPFTSSANVGYNKRCLFHVLYIKCVINQVFLRVFILLKYIYFTAKLILLLGTFVLFSSINILNPDYFTVQGTWFEILRLVFSVSFSVNVLSYLVIVILFGLWIKIFLLNLMADIFDWCPQKLTNVS